MYGSGLRINEALKLRVKDVEAGYDIRTIQKLLGHADVRTTEIYTHVVRKGGFGVRSPIDEAF